MPRSTNEALNELAKLKLSLENYARQELEKTNPMYVKTIRQKLNENRSISQAGKEAHELLRPNPPEAVSLLSAVLDVEITMDQLRWSLRFLDAAPPDCQDPVGLGAWNKYHLDHWFFLINAFLEKVDKLVKKTCRSLVKAQGKDFKALEEKLSSDINKMKEVVKKERDKLAHGGGSGIEAIEEQRLWEPYLAAPVSNSTFDYEGAINSLYKNIAPRRQTWHNRLKQVTILAIAASEAIFGEVNRAISE